MLVWLNLTNVVIVYERHTVSTAKYMCLVLFVYTPGWLKVPRVSRSRRTVRGLMWLNFTNSECKSHTVSSTKTGGLANCILYRNTEISTVMLFRNTK